MSAEGRSKKAGIAGLFRQDTFPLRLGARPGKRAGKPRCARLPNPPHMSPGSDGSWRASALQASQWGFRRSGLPMRRQLGVSTNREHFCGGGRKGRPAPSCAIRSGGVYAARSGCKPLPLSCSAHALRAQEHDVPFAARLRNSLAAKGRRKRPAAPVMLDYSHSRTASSISARPRAPTMRAASSPF